MEPVLSRSEDDALAAYLDQLELAPGVRALAKVPDSARRSTQIGQYHRRTAPGVPFERPREQQILSLVRERGMLRWCVGTPMSRAPGARASGRAALPDSRIVRQLVFERLEGSAVTNALQKLDRRLTPEAVHPGQATGSGLRQWTSDRLVPFAAPAAAGKRLLLFVHGTFSNGEALLSEGLAAQDAGRKLLADVAAGRHYDLILAYDHPTLSVSPWLNAFDLAALLRPPPKSIDIVCHSRGGLVSRWFCEAFSDPKVPVRVVFVASPLAGTSLAAAPQLRSTLDLLTNVADVARTAADFAAWASPLFVGVSGLLRAVTAVTGTLANAPLLDAALAMVPGLKAQSREGNNEEVRRLRANTGGADFDKGPIRYFAIQSDFEPKDPKWSFLQYFSRPLRRIADMGADLVFPGQNDLVVDTDSMREVADGRRIPIAHDFGTNPDVHHLNYFRQPQTAAAIRASFRIS